MVKMKNNLVHIPAYGTPLEAYPPDGSATYFLDSAAAFTMPTRPPGAAAPPSPPLSLTVGAPPTRRWGQSSGFRCEEFGFGTGDWFDTDVFGSRATVEGATREEQIIGSPGDLRSRTRLRPQTRPANRARHGSGRQSLRSRRRDRPQQPPQPHSQCLSSLDYLAIWQAEMRSWIGPKPGEVDDWMRSPEFKREHDRIASHFDYLGRPDLVAEGVRLSAYVNRAHAIVSERRPGLRLLVCGWGGDHWMRSTDLYLGLDKTLPLDVIFSSLDNIDLLRRKVSKPRLWQALRCPCEPHLPAGSGSR